MYVYMQLNLQVHTSIIPILWMNRWKHREVVTSPGHAAGRLQAFYRLIFHLSLPKAEVAHSSFVLPFFFN